MVHCFTNKQLLLAVLLLAYASTLFAQTITPVQTDEIIIDNGISGKADPGDRIRYKVTIQNTGGQAGNNTQLNIVPDPRTTFVPGSFRSSPLALPDVYTCTGNVGINIPAASGVKVNDFDDNTAGLTVTAGTFATTQGGSIMLNADGSFMYTPPAGFTGTDTYSYTLNDGNGVGAPVPATDLGVITITVSNLLWFIDNSSVAATSDGRLTSPFKTLADFNASALPAVNQVIFIKNTGTNYTGGIVLKNGQVLYGSGHTGGSNLADAGVLPFALATNSKALPAINTTRPIITNSTGDGVTLAQDNTLRGFDVGACSDFGMENSGTSSVGNLVVSEVSINNTSSGAFDASHGSGTSTNVVFDAVSSSGGDYGIYLVNCQGTFTVNGGTITNPVGAGVHISGGSVTFSSSGSITSNSGLTVNVINHDSNNVTFSGNIASTGMGIRVQDCGGGIKTFSGTSKSLTTGSNPGVTLQANTGATINFTGGGLVITTASGAGFTATGGGTVNVTGTSNTISSTSATALNVTNTTIGASNLNFLRISCGNNDASADPANGIVLNTTGTSGGLIVTGTGVAGTGGTIQNCTSYGISLLSTQSPSFNNMIIQNIARNGIDGNGVVHFTFTNSTISNTGTAGGGQYEEACIAFEDKSAPFDETTISGVVTITGNTLNQPRRHALAIETWNGTISNLVISNNTITSGTTTATIGDAVHVLSQGSASTTAHISTGSIQNNNISGFRFLSGTFYIGGTGIFIAGGNTVNATVTTHGTLANPIVISGNDVDNMGSNGIQVSYNGVNGISHFNINNNGTSVDPMSDVEGLGISVFFGGNGTFSAQVNNNAVNNNGPTVAAGSSGIAVQVDQGTAVTDAPVANITVNNNAVINPDGTGIRGIVRNSNGSLQLKIQNNIVSAPKQTNRNGIRVDGGLNPQGNTTLCLSISGNTSAGSGVNQGIGIRKQGTVSNVHTFGIVGLSPSPTTGANAAAKVVSDNPSGGGCDVLSGDNFVSCPSF